MSSTILASTARLPRSLPWGRSARVAEVSEHIWKYLSPSSQGEDVELTAAAMVGWPEPDVATLGRVQFLNSPEVGAFLDALPHLARRLANSSDQLEETSRGRLRGPIHWQRTFTARHSTGEGHLFVTAPAFRVYQTPENELLRYVLDAVVDAGRQLGWSARTPTARRSTTVRDRLVAAERWQQNRMINSVECKRPTPRSLAKIRSGRHYRRYESVVLAHRQLVALVETRDTSAIRAAIEQNAIVTAEDSTLFELLALFATIDTLNRIGWNVGEIRLFQGALHADGHHDDGRRLKLWYQSVPKWLSEDTRYIRVSDSHGLTKNRTLRPDVVLEWVDRGGQRRVLLVECKLTQGGVIKGARAALFDLLAYRRNFHDALTGTGEPYGLGITWGEGIRPHAQSEVVLSTIDTLGEALLLTDN